MAVRIKSGATVRRKYISVSTFENDIYSYELNKLVKLKGAVAESCPAGRILVASGKKLLPGVNSGIKTTMVAVFDEATFFKGFIDPVSTTFAEHDTDATDTKPSKAIDDTDVQSETVYIERKVAMEEADARIKAAEDAMASATRKTVTEEADARIKAAEEAMAAATRKTVTEEADARIKAAEDAMAAATRKTVTEEADARIKAAEDAMASATHNIPDTTDARIKAVVEATAAATRMVNEDASARIKAAEETMTTTIRKVTEDADARIKAAEEALAAITSKTNETTTVLDA